MLPTLVQHSTPLTESTTASHILIVLPKAMQFSGNEDVFGRKTLESILKRRKMQPEEVSRTAVSGTLESGALCVWAMIDLARSQFDRQTAMRKAVQLLIEENPGEIHIAAYGDDEERATLVKLALYTTWVNAVRLPSWKTSTKNAEPSRTAHIVLYGYEGADSFALLKAKAEGNLLARNLTILPPNELTPLNYRKRVQKLAVAEGWKYTEFDVKALQKMGAGAFVAVAQGSNTDEAAIVHLQRRARNATKTVALVGKGICFDTGGHNLKPARHMHGMNEDMNGSAVALGLLLTAHRAGAPVNIDCWLAITQNLISPHAYKQNDIITSLNGTTIEIIHTDAEGRMVLADTLTLAAREKPDVMVDFATLTGSMHIALGSRYSGIFSNRDDLLERALAAGKSSGERTWAFPFDGDYDSELESRVADVKQCTLESEADHILAARFLSRFVDDVPWLHMDLSASNNKGGLGAVGSDITGFGVSWGIDLLASL